LNSSTFRPVASTASRMPLLTGAKHREVRGVGQVLFDERDGDIEGKARNRDARLCVDVPLSLARARHGAARCRGDHRGW
jgi:hypothetical protein